MIFSRQSFLSEKTFQFHELFYYKIAFQMKTFILSIIVTMITSVAGAPVSYTHLTLPTT